MSKVLEEESTASIPALEKNKDYQLWFKTILKAKINFVSSLTVQIVALSACVILLYWPFIPSLIKSWSIDFPGFIVPLVSVYLVWRKKSDLQKAKRNLYPPDLRNEDDLRRYLGQN